MPQDYSGSKWFKGSQLLVLVAWQYIALARWVGSGPNWDNQQWSQGVCMDQVAPLWFQSDIIVNSLVCDSTQKLEVLVGLTSARKRRRRKKCLAKAPAAPSLSLESEANKMNVCGLLKLPLPYHYLPLVEVPEINLCHTTFRGQNTKCEFAERRKNLLSPAYF